MCYCVMSVESKWGCECGAAGRELYSRMQTAACVVLMVGWRAGALQSTNPDTHAARARLLSMSRGPIFCCLLLLPQQTHPPTNQPTSQPVSPLTARYDSEASTCSSFSWMFSCATAVSAATGCCLPAVADAAVLPLLLLPLACRLLLLLLNNAMLCAGSAAKAAGKHGPRCSC